MFKSKLEPKGPVWLLVTAVSPAFKVTSEDTDDRDVGRTIAPGGPLSLPLLTLLTYIMTSESMLSIRSGSLMACIILESGLKGSASRGDNDSNGVGIFEEGAEESWPTAAAALAPGSGTAVLLASAPVFVPVLVPVLIPPLTDGCIELELTGASDEVVEEFTVGTGDMLLLSNVLRGVFLGEHSSISFCTRSSSALTVRSRDSTADAASSTFPCQLCG
jgi:hypothetical protein